MAPRQSRERLIKTAMIEPQWQSFAYKSLAPLLSIMHSVRPNLMLVSRIHLKLWIKVNSWIDKTKVWSKGWCRTQKPVAIRAIEVGEQILKKGLACSPMLKLRAKTICWLHEDPNQARTRISQRPWPLQSLSWQFLPLQDKTARLQGHKFPHEHQPVWAKLKTPGLMIWRATSLVKARNL